MPICHKTQTTNKPTAIGEHSDILRNDEFIKTVPNQTVSTNLKIEKKNKTKLVFPYFATKPNFLYKSVAVEMSQKMDKPETFISDFMKMARSHPIRSFQDLRAIMNKRRIVTHFSYLYRLHLH